jgi:ABC-type nitrate/sulfonate/bicarbonate transport system ATPase subunit
MTKIDVDNITHKYALPGKRELLAVKEINLGVERGEFVVIVGESGCGKSTLLNMVAGLLTPCSGVIRIDGQPITGPHFSRMMMFQKPSLLPWLTVEENIAFGCKIRNEKKCLIQKVDRFIEQMGIKGFGKVYPHNLSVGMLQRAALALALIGEPEILLLDECFSDIDVFTHTRLLKLLLDLWQQFGLTIIHVTHDIEEGLLLGQRVVVMGERPGKIKHIFPVNLPYPRDIQDIKLNYLKKEILERFNE